MVATPHISRLYLHCWQCCQNCYSYKCFYQEYCISVSMLRPSQVFLLQYLPGGNFWLTAVQELTDQYYNNPDLQVLHQDHAFANYRLKTNRLDEAAKLHFPMKVF